MSTYKYILFDWDGNLAKTLDLWLEACKAPIEKRGLKLTDEEVAASFGAFPKHLEKWGFNDIDAIVEEADAIAKQKLPDVELYPDALEVLDSLHSIGKKLALITTSPHENVAHLLDKHKLTHYFDALVAGDDTKHHKPHPEPLEKALELLGGTKEHAIMIGDTDKDLGAAVNTGVDSILFYPPEHSKFYDLAKLKEHKPTYIVSDFREVINIVQIP